MQNIEFKAELRHIEAARQQCRVIGAQRIGQLLQTDTYFQLPDGRLKKRQSKGEPIEWIFYHRMDRVYPKMSNYTILTDAQAKRRWGTKSLKPWLKVIKIRELWLIEEVRIHLDEVEELGNFIEFEAMISRKFDVKMGHQAIATLRAKFQPVMGEPIGVSYSDLMQQLLAEKR